MRVIYDKNDLQYTLLLLIQTNNNIDGVDVSEFTIHFATINTSLNISRSLFNSIFTIHFATINTYWLLY